MSQTTPAPARYDIPVRRMDFQFDDDIPTYWFGKDPFRTLLLTALSGTFPEGERFFVDAVRLFRDRIEDPALRQAVSGFIGQEAHHAKEHEAFNALMKRKGLPMPRIEAIVRQGLRYMREKLSPQRRLAMTCALEHFTAIMAELLLENPQLLEQMDPRVRALWIWHAIEESEHKAVAFDVYQETVKSYWVRVSQMAFNTLEFQFFITLHFTRLMRHAGHLGNIPMIAKGLYELYVNPGWFRKLIPAYLDYYRPDFHPWQRDNKATLAFWRRELEKLQKDMAKNQRWNRGRAGYAKPRLDGPLPLH